MLVVSNSSPLIALAHVGQLDLIRALLGEVIVPPAVVREVFGDRELPPWVRIRAPAQPFAESVSPALGPGERDAIALAIEAHAARIILDDLPARRFAASLGLVVVGTAGLLLAAKTAGIIPAVAPILDDLLASGFRLSPVVLAAVLVAAGEAPA